MPRPYGRISGCPIGPPVQAVTIVTRVPTTRPASTSRVVVCGWIPCRRRTEVGKTDVGERRMKLSSSRPHDPVMDLPVG